MAFVHGKNASVLLDGSNLTGYLNALDMSVDVDTAETSTFGNGWKTNIAGHVSGTVGFGGLFDPTDSTAVNLIGDLPSTTAGVLTWSPAGGSTIGDVARLASIIATSYAEGSSIGDAVTLSWDVLTTGAIGFGNFLHPLGAETVDANGANLDGGATSTNGAIAHLHVTSVSSGDDIAVTIEHSDTGSSGWTTIGTFTTASAAGGQRLAINGSIKRYTRAVWNITDNGGPSIVFAVAIARL